MEQRIIDKEKLWQKVLTEVKPLVSKASFVTWFQNTNIKEAKENIVFLNVPNSFTKEWLQNKYGKFITSALRKNLPSIKVVEYVISNQPLVNTETSARRTVSIQTNDSQLEFNELQQSKGSLNPRYTFENFVVGSFNELAHAAAVAVSENLGTLYNPLFVYGGVGLGKTHLLQAIGNKIKQTNPDLNVKYITSEKFGNEVVSSIQNKSYQYKEKYKRCDLLIMDDVQFFAGKTKTREEFFHIFNTLHQNNKQVVFSSDRQPKSIPDLEERLRSRFEGGMIADITQPEYEDRIAVLKSKMQEKNLDLNADILDCIAVLIKDNIRELEGALNLLLVQKKLLKKELQLSEVKEMLNKNILYPRKKVNFEKVVETVAEFYETTKDHLFEKSRKKEHVVPRQIAMFLLRRDFNASYPYIGQKFGGRDHTTVIHSFEKISEEVKNNPQLKNEIQRIKDSLYKL